MKTETTELQREIKKLKAEKNALILAHYYQEESIQEVADFVGDSLALAKKAMHTDADIILFAGVYFMGETAKILNPSKKVIIPDLKAGCSLVDGCPPEEFRQFIERYPDHKVVTYINSSIEVKAMSDFICTSSNAVEIVNKIPRDQPIIFAPDAHLGKWVEQQTGRKMVLWQGECIVHQAFAQDKLIQLFRRHPDAQLIAHPESHSDVLKLASFVGSTTKLIQYVVQSENHKFIIGTEPGVFREMKLLAPDKTLIALPSVEDNACACSECAFMKMNTLEKLYSALLHETPEVNIEESLAAKAMIPLQRMLN